MISFIEDSNQTSSDYLSVVEALESQNNRIIKLMEQVQQVDLSVKTSKQFIQRELMGTDKSGSAAAQASFGDESSGGDFFRR